MLLTPVSHAAFGVRRALPHRPECAKILGMERTSGSLVRRGPVGGAGGEAGSAFRSGVAAYVAAHILRGQPFTELELLPEQTVPVSMRLEADAAVDDLVVTLAGGGMAFLQAKRVLNFGRGPGSLNPVVEQWIALDADEGVDPSRHRLVAVAAEASASVRALGSALRRRRRRLAEDGSTAERAALRRLECLLDGIDAPCRDRILASAVIWIADLEEVDGLSARLGQALLEPGVVTVGSGVRAWKCLRAEARDLARRRFGATLEDLVGLIRDYPLELVGDSDGYASARNVQKHTILAIYRERVRQAGERLDLRSLGAALPPLHLEEVDADIGCVDPEASDRGDEHRSNGGLPWALRRRGRTLLLGLPGSGKSTALRAAAGHYAARPSWPLPLVVRLDRVARLLDTRGFDDALLEAAFQDEPVDQQAALRDAAVQALRSGDATLFIDALDETGKQRHRVVADLEVELRQMHPAVEVLLSTRDVAYADGQTLGFRDLRLIAPQHPHRAARAVLRAAAEQRGISPGESGRWVDVRVAWVRERLSTDPALRGTPLMVVLLALLAAEHTGGALPHARAFVLERIVEDVVRRWEAGVRLRQQPARIGVLRDTDAVNAAWAAFSVIGLQVYARAAPPLASVTAALAEHLAAHYGLAAGLAVGAAHDAVGLWDEAGVFVVSGAPPRVTARVRLFAELAESLRVCALASVPQRRWVADAVDRLDALEPLLLAATRSTIVGDELARLSVAPGREGRLLRVVVEAVRQGCELSDEASDLLVRRLCQPAGGADAEVHQRALTLVSLPVAIEAQPSSLAFLDTLRPTFRTVARAIAVATWQRTDSAVAADLLAVLELDPESGLDRSVRERYETRGAAPYEEALLIAATRLVTYDDQETAELAAQRLGAVSIATGTQLRRRLSDAGHAELLVDADRPAAADWIVRDQQDSDRAESALLDTFASLAPQVEISRSQRRRLDELVDLVRTSGFHETRVGDAIGGVLRDNIRMRIALEAAGVLGGLELGVVASQADELREVIAGAEEGQLAARLMLTDGGRRLSLAHWDRVEDPTRLAYSLASAVTSPYPWIGGLAIRCLQSSPRQARLAAIECLDAMREDADGHHSSIGSALAATLLRQD